MSFAEALKIIRDAEKADDPAEVMAQLGSLDLSVLKTDQVALLYSASAGMPCISGYLGPKQRQTFRDAFAEGALIRRTIRSR